MTTRASLPRRVELWMRRYPITIFQGAVFAIHHESDLAWILLIGAFLADRHFSRIESADLWLSETWKVLRFVRKHAACAYRRFDLASVVDPRALADYQAQLVGRRLKALENRVRGLFGMRSIEAAIHDRTRLYTVTMGRSRTLPGPTAFMTDLGGFIFLLDRPGDIKEASRFYLLHELGHISPHAKYTWRRGRVDCAPLFGLFYWVLPQVLLPRVGGWTFGIVFLYWTAITLFRDVRCYVKKRFGLVVDEIYADRFAFLTLLKLHRRELVEVAELYKDWRVPEDPTIPADIKGMDDLRRDILELNFEEARKRKGRVRGYSTLPQFVDTDWPAWVCLAVAALFVPAANAPSCNGVAAAGILSFAAIFLFWLLRHRALRLEGEIEAMLAGAPSIPADVTADWPVEPRWQRRLRRDLGFEAALIEKPLGRTLVSGALGGLTLCVGLLLVTLVNDAPRQAWCLPDQAMTQASAPGGGTMTTMIVEPRKAAPDERRNVPNAL